MASDLVKWIDITMSAGVDTSDVSLGPLTQDTYVADAANFDFNHGAAFTRAGHAAITFSAPGATPAFSEIETLIGVPRAFGAGQTNNTFIIGVVGGITSTYRVSDLLVGISLSATLFTANPSSAIYGTPTVLNTYSYDFINGDIVFSGGNDDKLLVITTDVREVANTPRWKYIIAHKSRLFGANGYGSGAAPTYRTITVGWSKPGDYTAWTGPGAEGQLSLVDSSGDITGLANLRDTIVIYRLRGIVLAKLTGQSVPAYNLNNFEKDGVGCAFPDTLASGRSISIFAGEDDIYMFDLSQITPLGGKVRSRVVDFVYDHEPHGRLLFNAGRNRSTLYVLRPSVKSFASESCWVYDLNYDSWQRYEEPSAVFGSDYYVPYSSQYSSAKREQVTAIRSGATTTLYTNHPGTACNREAWVKSRTFVLGDPTEEWRVNRVLLAHKCETDCTVTVRITYVINDSEVYVERTVSVTASSSNYPRRLWVDFASGAALGNFFSIKVTYSAGSKVTLFKVMAPATKSGDFRKVTA